MTEKEKAGRSALSALNDDEGFTIGAWIAELQQRIDELTALLEYWDNEAAGVKRR